MEHKDGLNGYEVFGQFKAQNLDELAARGLHNFIEKTEVQENKQKIQKEKVEKEAVNNFIKNNKASLLAFSGDKTINYVPSVVAETMAFYHKEGKIELPTKWFNGEYTSGELLFGCGHEIAHFRDMRKNPEAYFENFEYIRAKGKDLAKDYHDKHPEQGREESMARFFAGEVHALYDYLDDIYVNKLAMDKAPTFHYDKKNAVTSLYDRLGFKDPNLTEQPLHRQMIFALLRDEMVGDEFGESIVDERVKEILDKKKMGKTLRDLVSTELKPIGGTLIDPGKRYKVIRQFLEKSYLELLNLALEEKNKESEEQSGSGESGNNGESSENGAGEMSDGQAKNNEGEMSNDGEPDRETGQSSDEFNPFGEPESRPQTILSEHTIEEDERILNEIAEQNEIDEMSPEERAKYDKQKQRETFDKRYDISAEDRKEYNETAKNVDAERKKMRKFWDGLIGKSISLERRLVSNQRKGRLNVDSLIRQYPDFVEAQNNGKLDDLTIYDNYQVERVAVNKPEEIEITLLVDGSGSMDGESIRVAREAATLLMLSIKDFNNKLEASRKDTHSKLVAKTEVMMFGSEYETVKDFEKTAKFDATNEAEIIKSVSKMQAEYGGTDDATPLHEISSKITPEQKSKIDKQKLLKIVFEITDGEPNDASETKLAVEKLKSEGVLVFAFQIGERNEAFEYIWNDSANSTGIFIGDNVKNLPDSLMKTLSGVMKGVRI